VYIRSTPTLFQANSKFSQIEQSPANAEQNPAKKKAWISLDFLVGNEPFQWVALTPGAKNPFSLLSLPRGGHSGRIVIARSHRASKDARLSTGYGDAAIQESWGVLRSNGLLRSARNDNRVTLHSATGPMYHNF
jgi:hypothetical protein